MVLVPPVVFLIFFLLLLLCVALSLSLCFFFQTGQSAYAFNVIQRSFLPAIFRPPENACSSSIDG